MRTANDDIRAYDERCDDLDHNDRAYQTFDMSAIEAAERRIRDAYYSQWGCLPSAVWIRDKAIILLREEAAERHEGEEP